MNGIARRFAVLALIAALLGPAPAFSQNAPPVDASHTPSAAQAAQVPLRASTHLVQVSVIVQDKKGNPITDLAKDEFQIFYQNKPQTVSVFSMETTHLQPGPSAPASSNSFTNRIDRQGGVPTSITVILLDLLNTHFSDMAYARQQIKQFLKGLQPQDRVALFGLTDRLTLLHSFTNDTSALLQTLDETPNREIFQASTSEFNPSDIAVDGMYPSMDLDGFIDRANQSLADISAMSRALTTARALEDIADFVSRLPGRKNLIWISGGFPIDINTDQFSLDTTRRPQFFSDEVERAARALNDSSMAIYPVDARGLIGLPPVLAANTRGRKFSAGPVTSLAPDQSLFDTMNILADRTGGRAYYNTNDIKGAIRQAIDDSRVTYVLGYYPDHGQWNGKFREVKIKVNRPDMNLRYRRGYFALPDETPLDAKTTSVLLLTAAGSPIDSTTIGMSVSTKAVDVPGAQVLKASMILDTRDLVINEQKEHWTATIDLLFAQIGGDGKVVFADPRHLELNMTDEDYRRVVQQGLNLNWSFPIAANAKEFRMIARDSASGATGSVTLPLLKLFPSLN